MTPDEYCLNKTIQSGSSFYYSFLLLPEDRKNAIIAFYAFCREVDDIVDSNTESHIKKIKLDWWRTEIESLFSGQPQHPISQALAPAIEKYNLAKEYFFELIDGMEMDLHNSHYDDFKTLRLYCYRVAGVVGIVSAEIFGYTNRSTYKYAVELGIAFQLTNIIRDIREDALNNRVYIPVDDLEKFNLNLDSVYKLEESENMQRLIAHLIERANNQYKTAFALLANEDRYAQQAGIIMANIYRVILNKIEKNNLSILKKRVSISPLRKLWITWRTKRYEAKLHKKMKRSG